LKKDTKKFGIRPLGRSGGKQPLFRWSRKGGKGLKKKQAPFSRVPRGIAPSVGERKMRTEEFRDEKGRVAHSFWDEDTVIGEN